MENRQTSFARNFARFIFAAALGVALALTVSTDRPLAQRAGKDVPVKVTGVNARTSDKEAVVTISGDGNLTRAQTWQDKDGFHVILPKGQTDLRSSGAPRGVKVQRVGDSLEIIVPTKPGSTVTVNPKFNRLDLIVNGGIQEDAAQGGANVEAAPREERATSTQGERQASATVERASKQNASRRASVADAASELPPVTTVTRVENFGAGVQNNSYVPHNNPGASQTVAPQPSNVSPGAVPTGDLVSQMNSGAAGGSNVAAGGAVAGAQAPDAEAGGWDWATYGKVAAASLVGLVGLVFVARRRRRGKGADEWEETETKRVEAKVSVKAEKAFEPEVAARKGEDVSRHGMVERRTSGDRRGIGRGGSDRRRGDVNAEPDVFRHASGAEMERAGEIQERKFESRTGALSAGFVTSGTPSIMFGAYRIEQEVGKLTNGQPHSIDVLASRATDDRRAIEASLIKALRASGDDVSGRRRVCTALEEYGFVARLSAALLLATSPLDRASAARVLGEVRSPSSMPFLLEALYDGELVVRNEVVASIGAMGLPRAIGALLDMARRYPEMPATLIGTALDSCSFESMEIVFDDSRESGAMMVASVGSAAQVMFDDDDFFRLAPVEAVEQLPEWLEDESLADALEHLMSADVEARTAAVQSLAQYQVQRAVDALAAMSVNDASPVVRAAAVTSLGTISHESVFSHVLVAMSDDAREVRAAAARSLSRLSFDRASAYVRVIETADSLTLRRVAQSCVKAGLAAQAIDRLTSEDKRQAYEAFALLSLAAKAGEVAPLLEAIEYHGSLDVRFAVVKLLGMTAQPSKYAESLREFASHGNIPKKLSAAILDTVNRVGQPEMRVM